MHDAVRTDFDPKVMLIMRRTNRIWPVLVSQASGIPTAQVNAEPGTAGPDCDRVASSMTGQKGEAHTMSSIARPTIWLVTGANRDMDLELVCQLLTFSSDLVVAVCRLPSKATALEDPKRSTTVLDNLINNAAIDGLLALVRMSAAGPAQVAQVAPPFLSAAPRKRLLHFSIIAGSIRRVMQMPPEFASTAQYPISKVSLNMLVERPNLTVIALCAGWDQTCTFFTHGWLKESVAGIIEAARTTTKEDSGQLLQYDGESILWHWTQDNATRSLEEIDAVTGGSRLPTHDDRSALPYVNAVMSECMRWTCPVPFRLPHQSTEDDVYEGVFIPKGTLVFANIWKMTRDPTLFPKPEAFIPERYLEDVDEGTARLRDPRNYIFGFGRRRCPGTHLVESYLWLAIACMLATFDFAKATDADDNVMEPQPEYLDALFRIPTPLPCNFRPRSGHAAQLVHEALAAST
ncbi:hypothetical protein VTO73DRAFT_2447 [Trametes versicolor]